MENYYKVLEVEQSATKKEIKKSYYRLAKLYHPDHNKDDATAAEKFKLVGEAYRVLSDDAARANYDRELAEGPKKTAPGQPKTKQTATPGAARKPKAPGASAAQVDFQNLAQNFAAFYGFNPKTKEVTNEDKLGTYVPKEKKKNPLDMTDMFERFMGIK